MDIVERARADVLRSGTWADTGELILEMAEEIERLRAENRADKIKLAEQWDRAEKAEAAIAAEREAWATICDNLENRCAIAEESSAHRAAAAAIRNRSQT